MNTKTRLFIALGFVLVIVVVIAVLGPGSSLDKQQVGNIAADTPTQAHTDARPVQASTGLHIQVLEVSASSLTYRIDGLPSKNGLLRIIDTPSNLVVWGTYETSSGAHALNLSNLPLGYEGKNGGNPSTSLRPGAYRLRLEEFTGGIRMILAESDVFTVPGTAVALPTCSFSMTPESSRLRLGENTVTLTWTSKNASEAYMAHSVPGEGSAIIYALKHIGRKVSLNGSEIVNIEGRPNGATEGYWLVVKNARGATICFPDGRTYFNTTEELENPAVYG